jgi:hypothetical protein
MLRGGYPGSLKNSKVGTTLPSFNPGIMHQTIKGILREKRAIGAVSMGVGTLWGYNLHQNFFFFKELKIPMIILTGNHY